MNVLEIIGYVLLSIAIFLGAVLLLFIILILTTSVTVHAEYDNEISFKVKYLFFTVTRSPKSPSQIKKKKRREQKKRIKELKKREKLRRKYHKAEHLKTPTKKFSQRSDFERNKTDTSGKTISSAQSAGVKSQQEKPQSSQKSIKTSKLHEDKKAKIDFQMAMRIFNSAKPHIKRLFKKIRFTDVLVDIMVGGDDAAKAAISYGIHCSAIYGLIEFIKRTVTFEAERITIKADFDLPKTDYYIKGTVKLRLSTLLHCAAWGFMAASKEINKNSYNTEKKTNVKDQPLKKAG